MQLQERKTNYLLFYGWGFFPQVNYHCQLRTIRLNVHY